MSTSFSRLAIIGGGPAGLAAAIEASENGIETTIVDKDKKLGGQFYSQFPDGFDIDISSLDKDHIDHNFSEGAQLLGKLEKRQAKIKSITEATVWGIFPERTIAYVKNGKTHRLKFDKLILAEGALERSLPFPGWTLPGVTTAGCAQKLLKRFRVLPGKRVLLSGTGPLQLVLANQLIKAGVQVVAVLESASVLEPIRNLKLKYIPSILRNVSQLKEGWLHLRLLKKQKIPYLQSHAIVSANGNGQVESARYARLNRNGEPIPGTEYEVMVDSVCLGNGFLPSTTLSHLAGAKHVYRLGHRSLSPVHDKYMETTEKGIFVIGDMAGVAGHLAALEEGRLAGTRVSFQLGTITSSEEIRRTSRILKKLKTIRLFSDYLDAVYRIKPGLYSRITKDTIVCRCEEITAGELLNSFSTTKDTNLNEIKKISRAGMGPCQGRTCSETIAALASIKHKTPVSKVGSFTFQEPPYPVRIEEMVPAD